MSNLAGGGVVERFDDELKTLLANILDPNTTLATREITLKVKIKPNQNRDFGSVDVEVKSKLAPAMPLGTKVFIAVTKNGAVATEYNSRQPNLPEVLTSNNAKVTPLRTMGGN